jgi:hypothetical protein
MTKKKAVKRKPVAKKLEGVKVLAPEMMSFINLLHGRMDPGPRIAGELTALIEKHPGRDFVVAAA